VAWHPLSWIEIANFSNYPALGVKFRRVKEGGGANSRLPGAGGGPELLHPHPDRRDDAEARNHGLALHEPGFPPMAAIRVFVTKTQGLR
jgi:hypothetical protein